MTVDPQPAAPDARAADRYLWMKLALALVLFGCWVEWWFVPQRLAPVAERSQRVLRDRSEGQRVGLLFELLPARAARTDLLVVIVGDSTVKAGTSDFFGRSGIPSLLLDALGPAFPDRRVGVIDLSQTGLYAPDALLFVAKAFGVDPDLVIYAVSPRIVPTDPGVRWTTSVGDLAFDPDILAHAGVGAILRLVDPRALGRTLAYSYYPPLRVRTELAEEFWRTMAAHTPAALAPLWRRVVTRERVATTPMARGAAGEEDAADEEPEAAESRGAYVWPASRYRLDPPTRSTRALDALLDLCARERRCLLYHGPVNRAALDGFEPGLVETFAAWVRARADARAIPFRDYRALGEPIWFRTNTIGKPDAIHLGRLGRRQFTTVLAADAVNRLRELAR